MGKLVLAIHGGAGSPTRRTFDKEQEYRESLSKIVQAGYEVLKQGGTALDAVEFAVRMLEDDELYNAGRGSCLNCEGDAELDAAIMSGVDLGAGAICAVTTVRNPISLARIVMTDTPFVMFAGKGAEDLAEKKKLDLVENKYFITEHQLEAFKKASEKSYGTVGAVALDSLGNLAAATSTGGTSKKYCGRIGDSPLIGAGTYANNKTCAISCTGDGEYFIRSVAAYDVSCLMEYKGLSLKEAADIVIHDKVKNMGGEGGLIAIDRDGNVALPFNCGKMARASITDGEMYVGLLDD